VANKTVFHTRLCDMFDIEFPILLAGMGGLAGEGSSSKPKLVAAVSNAGGMGVLGATALPLDELRTQIREIKKLTNKPFGVDILLPGDLTYAPPEGMSLSQMKKQFVPKENIDFIEKLRVDYGLPVVESETEYVLTEEHSKKQIALLIEEKVPLFCTGLGLPDWLVPMAHEGGMKVLGLAGNVKAALRHNKSGADIIVAQGHEAGGHTGRIGTFALVPQVVDAVTPTPVLAAGGIGDGRGLVAALALGAIGVWVGTAFLFADEANVRNGHREMILKATEEDTVISRVWSGKPLRQLKNPIQEAFDKSGLRPLSFAVQLLLMDDFINSIAKAGRDDLLCLPTGQIVGMLKEKRPAREILNEMVDGAAKLWNETLPRKIKAK